MTVLSTDLGTLAGAQTMLVTGRVAGLRGLTVLVDELPLPIGALVSIGAAKGRGATLGEVVGLTREHAAVMLLGQTAGIRVGDPVHGEQTAQTVRVGGRLLGRVIDGLGRPIDGKGPVHETVARRISPEPIRALERRPIAEALHSGVRAIDLMATLGRGQRVGIFAGPGVGKSTLLGTIARNASSDVNVIALVGERGREVGDFLESSLGPEGLARSVVVVATGDESPLLRIRAALVACAAAEHFRDLGLDVLLMMDSVTRFAHAQRQVGLSVGEPPATKGYTPSVFASLALLLERAGAVRTAQRDSETARQRAGRTSPGSPATGGLATPSASAEGDPIPQKRGGSITGLYTILVEGDDLTEPVSDAARGILDGHIILSRKLAQRSHYPAIDVLDSVSRVADAVCDKAMVASRQQIARMLAAYRDVEDLVQIGAYASGSNPEADVAIEYHARLMELLRQGRDEREPFAASRERMVKLAMETGEAVFQRRQKKGR